MRRTVETLLDAAAAGDLAVAKLFPYLKQALGMPTETVVDQPRRSEVRERETTIVQPLELV